MRKARNADELELDLVLITPCGCQAKLEKRPGRLFIRVEEISNHKQNYDPCINVIFENINEVVGKRSLAFILSGIGRDGESSCRNLKIRGAKIWAQDEESSIVYDMPGSVEDIATRLMPVRKMAVNLLQMS